MRTSPCSYHGMGVSPCTAWCAAYARPSPRHASTWSFRSAKGACDSSDASCRSPLGTRSSFAKGGQCEVLCPEGGSEHDLRRVDRLHQDALDLLALFDHTLVDNGRPAGG